MTITKLLLVCVVLYSANSLGVIYKCIDANGHRVYSDNVCNAKAGNQAVELPPSLAEVREHPSFFSRLTGKIRSFFKSASNAQPSTPELSSSVPTITQPSVQCDGRTLCSQMTSCDEATFFINHCPNTEMDGDNDGVPCESQWCR